MKSNAMKKEHHELEKVLRNREHSNDDHSNDTFNEHTESISSCDVIEESIIIINSYIFVTSIKSTHEKLYAMCVE